MAAVLLRRRQELRLRRALRLWPFPCSDPRLPAPAQPRDLRGRKCRAGNQHDRPDPEGRMVFADAHRYPDGHVDGGAAHLPVPHARVPHGHRRLPAGGPRAWSQARPPHLRAPPYRGPGLRDTYRQGPPHAFPARLRARRAGTAQLHGLTHRDRPGRCAHRRPGSPHSRDGTARPARLALLRPPVGPTPNLRKGAHPPRQ